MSTYAVIFAAIIIAVQGAPAPQTVEIDLTADGAAVGVDGVADASQALTVLASGSLANPADIVVGAGTGAGVLQDINIVQLADALVGVPSTTTTNLVSASNSAVSGDHLDTLVHAANQASVQNAGASNSGGAGAVAANAATHNQVNQ